MVAQRAPLSPAEERLRRLQAQRLGRRSEGDHGDLAGLIRHLLAVQAQDPAAFPLAIAARVSGVTAEDLAAARQARTIVRCWGPRGTLHLIAADDLAWLYPLVKPAPAGSIRRLRQLGVESGPEVVVAAVSAVLAGHGPLTKGELGERLAKAGLPAAGQAIVHAAMLAAGRGLVVLGPEQGGKPTYVHAADWLGAPLPTETPDRAAAVRMLVTRYRAAHDPCTAADLASWSGLPLGEVADAWAPEAAAVLGSDTAQPSVRLVPAYDEYLLGWRTREHAVPDEFRGLIHPGGGVIRPAVLVDGLVAGTWGARRSARRVDVTVSPFAPLGPDVRPLLAAEGAAIGEFLGAATRLTVR